MAKMNTSSPLMGEDKGGGVNQSRTLRKNMTDAERKLWCRLSRRQLNGVKFRRQALIGPYIVDFVSFESRIVIEVDGGQHMDHAGYDQQRTAWLRHQGFRVLRFWNNEVLRDTNVVVEEIQKELCKHHPHLNLPPSRGKRIKETACFVALLLASSSFLFASEPMISRVALSQKVVDLSKNEKAAIEFQLSEQAFVDLDIYDESNQLIFKRAGEKALKKGKRKLEWDGRNQAGEQVVSGVYIYVLEASPHLIPPPVTRGEDRRGAFIYDPREKTGGEEVFVEKLSWNVPKKEIKYILPQASYVRTRIGLKSDMLMGTLEDWTPYGAGEKTVPWNGRDPEGFFDLSNHPEAQINISAFALPDNALIVKSETSQSLSSPLMGEDQGGGDTIPPSLPSPTSGEGGYIHAHHPRALCHEPKFQVEFPVSSPLMGEDQGGGDQVLVLKGKVPVRITLDPKDRDYLTANRFEVMFFVDSVFLFEQEEATSPFTIELDSKRLGVGEHLLTINVMDYEDHIGVKTVRVKVESESPHA